MEELPRLEGKADPVGFFFLGLTLATIGVFGLLAEMGLLAPLEALSYCLLCLGALLMADGAIRYLRPWTRHKTLPLALAGSLMASSGLSLLLAPRLWWCALLICLGCWSMFYGLFRLRPPSPARR